MLWVIYTHKMGDLCIPVKVRGASHRRGRWGRLFPSTGSVG